jgi:hypothetical protein
MLETVAFGAVFDPGCDVFLLFFSTLCIAIVRASVNGMIRTH